MPAARRRRERPKQWSSDLICIGTRHDTTRNDTYRDDAPSISSGESRGRAAGGSQVRARPSDSRCHAMPLPRSIDIVHGFKWIDLDARALSCCRLQITSLHLSSLLFTCLCLLEREGRQADGRTKRRVRPGAFEFMSCAPSDSLNSRSPLAVPMTVSQTGGRAASFLSLFHDVLVRCRSTRGFCKLCVCP